MREIRCPECRNPLTDPDRCLCGWVSDESPNSIDKYPKYCMVKHCNNVTAVVYAVGADPSGTRIKCAPSELLIQGKAGTQERKNCVFESWITRCSSCYLRESIHAHKATPVALHAEDYHKTFLTEHPEFSITPGPEEQESFQQMCMAWIRKSYRMRPLPYKKTERTGQETWKTMAPEREKELLDQLPGEAK